MKQQMRLLNNRIESDEVWCADAPHLAPDA